MRTRQFCGTKCQDEQDDVSYGERGDSGVAALFASSVDDACAAGGVSWAVWAGEGVWCAAEGS